MCNNLATALLSLMTIVAELMLYLRGNNDVYKITYCVYVRRVNIVGQPLQTLRNEMVTFMGNNYYILQIKG